MSEQKDFYFPSYDGKNKMFVRLWIPEGEPRAILQLAHGVDEHILRYDAFARFLNEQGILVAGNDHLGHGRSVPEGGVFNWFAEEDGWTHVVSDLYHVHQVLRKQWPDTPCFLMGHSMGSFLARSFLFRHPGDLDGVILSGTNQMQGYMLLGGRLLAKLDMARNGGQNCSRLINNMAFGAYNKQFSPARTHADWLSRDEAAVDAHNADPFCNHDITSGLFYDMLGGLKEIKKPENLAKMDKDLPVLFFAGDRDPVGQNGKGVKKAAASFRAAGCKNVELKLYPGGRHEMLNETNKEEVYGDILSWLNGCIEE